MATFDVLLEATFKVTGHQHIEVEAETEEEARRLALREMGKHANDWEIEARTLDEAPAEDIEVIDAVIS